MYPAGFRVLFLTRQNTGSSAFSSIWQVFWWGCRGRPCLSDASPFVLGPKHTQGRVRWALRGRCAAAPCARPSAHGNGIHGEKRRPLAAFPGPGIFLPASGELYGAGVIFKRICFSVTVIWMTKLSPHNYPYQLCLKKTLFQQLLLLVKQKPAISFSKKFARMYSWRHPPAPLCETAELTSCLLFLFPPCKCPGLFKNTCQSMSGFSGWV